MNIYLVGGAVRDALLGLPVTEQDWVVVGATVDGMRAAGYRQVGKDFPVFLHPKNQQEYALARQERKSAPGYHGFAMDAGPQVTLEEDLLRRDLTVNAIAQAPDGTLIDPYGGQADLRNKVLRHVSPAFAEDPVRILRLARFAARFAPLGFIVAEETLALCRTMVAAGEVDALVPERVWKETERALMGPQPGSYFATLRAAGALETLFPELAALFGIPQRAEYHPEVCSGVHTLMCLNHAAQQGYALPTRVAALCHDFGKALSPAPQLPRHIGHEGSGVPLVAAFCQRLRVPNACRDVALVHTEEHLNIHRVKELRPDTLLRLLEKLRALKDPEFFTQVLHASYCDARGRLGLAASAYPQVDYLRSAAQAAGAVTAAQVMALGAKGAEVSQQLSKARVQALGVWKQSWV